jgi:mercuric ion transport protein
MLAIRPLSRVNPTNDRSLILTGGVAAVLAAICCATPILAIVLGAIGLTAWIAKVDYIVMPVLLLGVALVGLGLYRRHASASCPTTVPKSGDPK